MRTTLAQKLKDRSYHSAKDKFIDTIHDGFNYFHQFDQFLQTSSRISLKNSKKKIIRAKTEQNKQIRNIKSLLQTNKFKLQALKTEVNQLRAMEFNDYIKKSQKYQELLTFNDAKKKRLKTFNSKVGEIVKKAFFDNSYKSVRYQATFKQHQIEGWQPQLRQGQTCVRYRDTVILIGGHCSYPFKTIQIFSLQYKLWLKGFQAKIARSYHTSLIYRDRFIINFGGMGVYNPARKGRQCYNSIGLVDLAKQTSHSIKIQNQQTIQPRRSHSAVLMGKFMMVFGGMNSKKQYLKDLAYVDLKELKWYHKQYVCPELYMHKFLQLGLAKHSSIAFFKSRQKYPIYSSQYEDYEGIYLFGGLNQQGETNVISIINFNKTVPVLRRTNYIGQPPSSIDPLVQLYNEDTVLIISGDQFERCVYLFKIGSQKFTQVTYSSNTNAITLGGLGSSLVSYKDEHFLFYGLGEGGYLGNVNSFTIKQLYQQNSTRRKKNTINSQWKNLIDTINSKDNSKNSLMGNTITSYQQWSIAKKS